MSGGNGNTAGFFFRSGIDLINILFEALRPLAAKTLKWRRSK
jgi:hypothetical protein